MVYIKALNKNILPLFIFPEQNELFSSWFCRLAVSHSIKPQSFLLNYFDRDLPIFNRDIDLFNSEKLVDFFTGHSPLLRWQVEELFLNSYNSYAFLIESQPFSHINNILPLGIFHRDRKRFGMQYCPSCLNKKAFYKKEWRLVTSILCVECNEYLKDKCNICNKPIVYHKIYTTNNLSKIENFYPFSTCYFCKSDLAKLNPNKPKENEILYQKYIDKTIELGYNECTQYSFFYIKTLLFLSKRLMSNRKKNRFRDCLIDMFGVEIEINLDDIKYWSTEERINVLPLVFDFLQDVEKSKKGFHNYKISKSYIDADKALPFWLYRAFDL